jgi:hypothetical protein
MIFPPFDGHESKDLIGGSMKLTNKQRALHREGVKISINRRTSDAITIRFLQKAQNEKLHKAFGLRSLFKYTTDILKFDATDIYAYIAVAKKANEIPQLKTAIDNCKITIAAANRMVSTLTAENADELIEFCRTHSHRETEKELARINPKRRKPDKIKFISETEAEVLMTVSTGSVEMAEKTRVNEAQKGNNISFGEAYELAMRRDFERHDPIKRAERIHARGLAREKAAQEAASKRAAKENAPAQSVAESSWAPRNSELEYGAKSATYSFSNMRNDEPIPAHIQQAVDLRDRGECTHLNEKGERCRETRWTHTHHIIHRSKGGPNTLENLTTLCSFHHDMVHQLNLPMDGAFNLLRSPQRPYSINEETD